MTEQRIPNLSGLVTPPFFLKKKSLYPLKICIIWEKGKPPPSACKATFHSHNCPKTILQILAFTSESLPTVNSLFTYFLKPDLLSLSSFYFFQNLGIELVQR